MTTCAGPQPRLIRGNVNRTLCGGMDAGVPGELVMIDTWRRREDSDAAGARPAAVRVHERYNALGITVSTARRYEVVVA